MKPVGFPVLAFACVVVVLAARAQSPSIPSTNSQKEAAIPEARHTQDASATAGSTFRDHERIRMACIEGRRLICGRILELLPEGLVVESGYTNLLREPLGKSWLIPRTAQASKAENLIESKSAGAICVGRVLLVDTPKGKRLKPAKYDYVVVEAYPAGQFSYTSAGAVQRTVRRFSANLVAATEANRGVIPKTR